MRVANSIFAGLILLLMISLLYLTLQIPDPVNSNVIGAAYVPLLYIVVGIFLCVVVIITSILSRDTKVFSLDKKFYLYLLIIILYLGAINIVGYYISTGILIILLYWLLGIRKWWKLILIPAIYLMFIYVVFEQFISLPIP